MTDSNTEATLEDTPRAVEGFLSIGFFTADHAVVENGKIYANGAYWKHLMFPAFPTSLPSMAIVAIIQVPWHANNTDHKLRIELLDSDGQKIPGFQVDGGFRGAAAPQMRYGDPGVMPIVIPVNGLQFERPGDFSFVLEIDDAEVTRYPFSVMQVAVTGPVPMG